MANYNQNSGYGAAGIAAVHNAVPTVGRIFVVLSSSDLAEERYDRLQALFPPDPQGQIRFYNSLATAYADTTSNNHDVIVLDGDTTHTLSAELNVTNNRVHFVGLDYLMGIRRRYGHSTKVSLGVTTAAGDQSTVLNSGVRNSFRGIKFMNSNTVAQGIYCFMDGGEYTYMEGCEIYKSTDLDQTGAAELVCNGDSSMYVDCYIGSTVNAISGAIIRPCVLMSRGTISGKAARDTTFERCIFARNCGNAANRFIYGANANDVERMCFMNECVFWNTALAAGTPAQNVAFGAAQTDGSVLLNNCVAVNSGTAMSTTTNVFVNGSANGGDSVTEGAAQIGIALQAT